MANSSFIGKAKNKIIKEFIKDNEIIEAIGSTEIDSSTPEKYLNKHIFNFNQNPYTLNIVGTFITVLAHIQGGGKFVNATIEIYIVSHNDHMVVNNVPKVTQNRNDYLAQLIDKKLNGRSDFGIGELELQSNTEDALRNDYQYRHMVFQVKNINSSMCEDE